ncbi:MAG: type II secretion system protein [Elusimicrobiales bacterium]|nr:type II secretion system protein [Elusimicrobiales bacterium]
MKKKGFTLVELMIVIVIIGILAAVAVPKFADMVDKSKEGATKAQLTAIRGALQVYYSDNEGKFPLDKDTVNGSSTAVLTTSLIPKYISDIGMAKLPHKANNNNCATESSTVYKVAIPTANVSDTQGGWAYDSDDANNTWGDLKVNCKGNDLNGKPWTTY